MTEWRFVYLQYSTGVTLQTPEREAERMRSVSFRGFRARLIVWMPVRLQAVDLKALSRDMVLHDGAQTFLYVGYNEVK